MRQLTHQISVRTNGRRLYDITPEVTSWAAKSGLSTGMLTLYIQHTSASLLINENYDSDVLVDMEAFFDRLVPDGDPLFIHTVEGPDDMPAHVKAALLGCSVTVPVHEGRLRLGTWQGIYLCEHRNRASGRKLVLTLQGQRVSG